MIELYTWSTPNGRKVSIMLEETGLPYRVHPVDITRGEQFAPEFLAISPNNRIPAIVDPDGADDMRQAGEASRPLALMESGAILIYLAEKTGRFLPQGPRGRYEALQWLMFQMGNVGPMFGQAHHFRRFAPEPVPYAIERYSRETARLYRVLDTRLRDHAFLAEEYSIADIATYPWVARHEWQGIRLEDHPAVRRWYEAVGARPAVARGMGVPA
ncbi:MAG: glutathione S-transferase N-terminal domain-containing protein [Betaproteobacteria bacterium]|nr:glutathione S-transferase N-terminal domain-containing protein [Betaproteobacteria bacterium]